MAIAIATGCQIGQCCDYSGIVNYHNRIYWKQCEMLAQVDNETRRWKVNTARDIIYQQNYAVDSNVVENILKEQLLAPSFVSKMIEIGQIASQNIKHRMPF